MSFSLDPQRQLRFRSVDELSELEAFIDSCCHEAVRRGLRITSGVVVETDDFGTEVCCPLGAVGKITHQWWDEEPIFQDFENGFDAKPPMAGKNGDWVSYAMGARFRARMHRGEYLP